MNQPSTNGEQGFFPEFLELYIETRSNRTGLEDIAEIQGFFESTLDTICEVSERFFQEYINIDFYKPSITFYDFQQKPKLDPHLFKNNKTIYVHYRSRNIYVNLQKVDDLLLLGQTRAGLVFIIAHEVAHSIQLQLNFDKRKSTIREYHANYIAGALIEYGIKQGLIELTFEELPELMKILEIHGIITDLKSLLTGEEKTHWNGLECRRSFEEGLHSTPTDVMNTFSPTYAKIDIMKNVRPYQQRDTNCTGPDIL